MNTFQSYACWRALSAESRIRCGIVSGSASLVARCGDNIQRSQTTRAATPACHAAGVTSNTTVRSLNREWADLIDQSTATVAGWARQCPELAAASDLADVLLLIRGAPDEILGALIRLGAAGEPLAWRVVLQSMLGKVVRVTAGRSEQFGEAVSELWVAIAEYPLQRRPHSIAANLGWQLHRCLVPSTPALLPVHEAEMTAEDALWQARSLGLIDARTHRTLWLVYVAGMTSAGAARELGTSADAVRYHCSRSLRRLAGHADLLAA